MDITWKRKWIFWLLLAVMLLFLPGKTFAAEKESREAEDSYIYHTAFDAKASLKIRHMKDYGENPIVRRTFIFCLYCGLRFCDVKDLTYRNVDYANRLLKFEQSKTKGHSASSGVVIPLNDGLLSIIGEAPADKNCLIFDLPTYESCCKSVKRWVKRAGIDKHISWHCARHSFAVNILNNGANIKTVASLLGHSGLKHTEKYTRAVDKLKEEAINSLPELKF